MENPKVVIITIFIVIAASFGIIKGTFWFLSQKDDKQSQPIVDSNKKSLQITYDDNIEYVSNQNPKQGDTITIRFKNIDGYSISSVKVNGEIKPILNITEREHTFIITKNVELSTDGCYVEDVSSWYTCSFGKFKGGSSSSIPDGVDISVIYDKRVRFNNEPAIDNPMGNKMAQPGDRVIGGCYHQGNFRYGTIIHSDGTTEKIEI